MKLTTICAAQHASIWYYLPAKIFCRPLYSRNKTLLLRQFKPIPFRRILFFNFLSGFHMSTVQTVSRFALRAAISAMFIGGAASAFAAENVEIAAPLGIWDLDAAILPPSGFYGQIIAPSYRASKAKDANGNDQAFATSVLGVPFPVVGTVDAKVKADALIPRFIYIHDESVYGGRVGAFVGIPLVKKTRDIKVTITAPFLSAEQKAGIGAAASKAASGKESGLGDVEIGTFIGWKGEQLSVLAAFNVDLPTGSFDKTSQVNLGMNSYSFRPLISAAWSTESGFDLAASFAYNFSTANRDTKYKTGQYATLEYVGTYQFNDNVKAGLQGYALHQTRDDKDPQNSSPVPLVNGNRAHVVSIGPVARYQTSDLKNQVEVKYLKEFSARARPEGAMALATYSRLF
jgi:hypothetical protein